MILDISESVMASLLSINTRKDNRFKKLKGEFTNFHQMEGDQNGENEHFGTLYEALFSSFVK